MNFFFKIKGYKIKISFIKNSNNIIFNNNS